jgi:hypothetical protein
MKIEYKENQEGGVEAKVMVQHEGNLGMIDFLIVGYGIDEDEAKQMLLMKIDEVIAIIK